jgi:hypothetical protein
MQSEKTFAPNSDVNNGPPAEPTEARKNGPLNPKGNPAWRPGQPGSVEDKKTRIQFDDEPLLGPSPPRERNAP